MKKHPLHTLLLVIFALLQCAAPLVHAHVNGPQTGIIPPTLAAPFISDSGCFIEANESPAISLASELKRNNLPAIQQPSWTYTAEARPIAVIKFRPAAQVSVSTPPPYSTPLPQAPPVAS